MKDSSEPAAADAALTLLAIVASPIPDGSAAEATAMPPYSMQQICASQDPPPPPGRSQQHGRRPPQPIIEAATGRRRAQTLRGFVQGEEYEGQRRYPPCFVAYCGYLVGDG